MEGSRKRIREAPEVRRAQIIDEAIRIVGELGYYGLTVQGLARRCGLSNAGLLYYFGSKSGLLLALLDEIERREEEAIAPIVSMIEDEGPGLEKRRKAITELIGEMARRVAENREQGKFVAMLQAESMEPSHPAHQWFAQREKETIELLVRLLEPLTDAPQPLARCLTALPHGMVGQWLRSEQEFDLAEECEACAGILLSALPS